MVGGDYNAKNTYWGLTADYMQRNRAIRCHRRIWIECHSPRKPTYQPSDEKTVPDLLDFITTKT
jgi:hypothetical protein